MAKRGKRSRTRAPASPAMPLTREISRDRLKGGEREGPRRSRGPRPSVALIRRLRRLELALVSILAPERFRMDDKSLDQLVEDVLALRNSGSEGGDS